MHHELAHELEERVDDVGLVHLPQRLQVHLLRTRQGISHTHTHSLSLTHTHNTHTLSHTHTSRYIFCAHETPPPQLGFDVRPRGGLVGGRRSLPAQGPESAERRARAVASARAGLLLKRWASHDKGSHTHTHTHTHTRKTHTHKGI